MNWKKAVILLVVAIGIGLFIYLRLWRFLSLAALKSHHQGFLDFYSAHPVAMIAGFMVAYVVQTALSLPGAALFSLAAGAIFGAGMGTVYANIAATIGATLAFLVTRYLLHDAVQRRFGTQLKNLNRELEARGLNYLLFLRLVPIFPFFLINLGAGLTRLPLRTFIIGTMVGIIPGGFVYCNAGASLSTINSLDEAASPRVLGSFALLGLFALVPALYDKFKKRS